MNGRKDLSIRLAVCVLILALAMAVPAAADTHYVSPGQSIQEAIDDANDGDEIEVAPGTYNEAIDFKGKAVRLYSSGGPFVTAIDGTGHYHVVQCVNGEEPNTILEGFTISGGNANGPDPNDQYGGGMFNNGSSPTVTDCNFTGNSAADGGAIHNLSSSPTVVNCTFSGNTASNSGGGMDNYLNSNPTVTNCTFTGNTAVVDGGGMDNNNSSPTVTDCDFSQNAAGNTGVGGGMYNEYGNVAVTNCTFSANTAGYGAGIFKRWGSLILTNCTFSGNSSEVWGGGMYNYSTGSTVTNCTFNGNTALGGGGMYNYWGNPTVVNCILWDDMPDEIYEHTSTSTVTYSDVEGGWSGAGANNINADPCFVDAAGGDFRFISSGSPCVDTGDNSVVTEPNDLAGNPRVVDGDFDGSAVVDMGAYELQAKQIHNITQDRWYETLQVSIDDANNGDQIEVGPGIYHEAINFNGKAVRLYSSGGPNVTTIDAHGLSSSVVSCTSGEGLNTFLEGFTITGGSGTTVGPYEYGGGMYNLNSSPMVKDCNFTTNSVNGDGGGMYNNNSSPTVTNCSFSANNAVWAGGGMDNRNGSSPTVTDCTFSQNTAGTNGGGLENYTFSNPTVTNCTFISNSADFWGGGMSNENSSPTVTNCTFSNNSKSWRGGGMYNTGSSPTVTNCIFKDNSAIDGGGMFNYNSSPTVTNCIFNNKAYALGGGIANYNGSDSTATNCTFSGNVANAGGGIRNLDSNLSINNCILWDNEPDEISSGGVSVPVVSYSDVQGGWGGLGNINADPCFVDTNNPDPNLWNLRLQPDSPCIDAGNTTAVPAGIFVDADGNPRGLDDPQTPDTGFSILGVTVDMGAYEFQPCPIPGDINCDGMVDFKDLAILCGNWLAGVVSE